MAAPTKNPDVAPNRAERKACWDSRDAYWKCMDKNGLESDKCADLQSKYEETCPAQWVKHFDRKYVYEQYKKRIEKEGYEPITQNAAPLQTSSSGPTAAAENAGRSFRHESGSTS